MARGPEEDRLKGLIRPVNPPDRSVPFAVDFPTSIECVVFATKKQIPADNVGVLFTDVVMSSTQPLSVGQQFEVERFSRAIDATADPEQLKALAKQLLQAWHTQKAATEWVKSQQL